jgi:glutaredoxin 3
MAILGTQTQRETKQDHAEVEMDQKGIVLYTKSGCLYCWRTKRLLRRRGYVFEVIEMSGNEELRARLAEATGTKVVPQVFVDGRLVGSFDVVRALDSSGDLERLVRGRV